MSDDGYVPLAQPFADDEWEEVLTRWVKQAEPRALSLWLISRLRRCALPASAPLLDDMQRWVAVPDEKLRWQIFQQAETLGFDTPAGALALSLFWSQGSMSPQGLEPVYPEPHLSARMLRCVLLMLAMRNADNPADGTRQLLAQWSQENA